MTRHRTFAATSLVLLLGLLGPTACAEPRQSAAPPVPASPVAARLPQPVLVSPTYRSIADIAERALPSVVNISSTKVVHQAPGVGMMPFFSDPFFRQFFGPGVGPQGQVPRERRERSLGSGVIVSKDGIVLTNNHVVDKATEIRVALSDHRELKAKVLGTDPKSDLAVLRLEGAHGDLTPLPIGNSNRMRLGDVVLAIGNPFGVGETVTMGIVSATGRANVGIVDYEDFIQTDAAINPGNSGGALVNLDGELVGINTAILSRSGGYQGIGFAIPSNMAKPIMEALLEHGKVVRGWLGVAIQNLNPDLARALGLKVTDGVLVSDVQADSPAAKAGLRRGDVVLSLNGEKTDSTGRLRNLVATAGAGGEVHMVVQRQDQRLDLSARLGELSSHRVAGTTVQEEKGALTGLSVTDLTPAAREKYNLPATVSGGVVVTEIAPDSQAAEAGLRAGDVILEVNRKPVSSVKDFAERYESAKAGTSLVLLIYREGSTLFLLLTR